MEVAIITDTHFGCRKNSKLFHDYFEKFYKNTFFPTIDERGIKHIVHMTNFRYIPVPDRLVEIYGVSKHMRHIGYF